MDMKTKKNVTVQLGSMNISVDQLNQKILEELELTQDELRKSRISEQKLREKNKSNKHMAEEDRRQFDRLRELVIDMCSTVGWEVVREGEGDYDGQ